MSVPTKCKKCGYQFRSHAIYVQNATDIIISGNSERCPECGGSTEQLSGTYDFANGVITSIRDVSRADLMLFEVILKSVNSGEKDFNTAKSEIAQLNPALSKILNDIRDPKFAIPVLIAIFGLWLTHYHFSKNEASSLAATEIQAEAHKQNLDIQKLILEELRKRPEISEYENEFKKANVLNQVPTPRQKPVAGTQNRHERRKTASIAKKKK